MATVQVRPDYSSVQLPDGTNARPGQSVFLSDAQVTSLSPALARALILLDLAADLTTKNLVYPAGLRIVESDTNLVKTADGAASYNVLPYPAAPAASTSIPVTSDGTSLYVNGHQISVGGSVTKASVLATGVSATDLGGTTAAAAHADAAAQVQSLVGAAPQALDTIYELAAQMQSDESAAAALATAVANRLRTDQANTLTSAQKTQLITDLSLPSIFVTIVEHGSTANTVRPTGAIRVFWRGSVAPTNATTYDRWINTSTSPITESIYTGSVWQTLSGVAGAAGPAGPASFNPRGTYVAGTTYGQYDAVSYTANGLTGLMVALQSSVNQAPPTPAPGGASNAYWLQYAGPGSQGPAGSGAAGIIGPPERGMQAWTNDPDLIGANNGIGYQGQVFGAAVKLGAGVPVTGVVYDLEVAGANLVSGANFLGLYDPSGNLVAQTADLTSKWGTAPFETRDAFASAFTTTTAGIYYVGALCGYTTGTAPTPPKIGIVGQGGRNALAGPNIGTSCGAYVRFGRIGSANAVTALPSSVSYAQNSPSNSPYWYGLY